ncbi:MAG: histidine decarboxylase [Candidatus Saccharimonadales bacterium]
MNNKQKQRVLLANSRLQTLAENFKMSAKNHIGFPGSVDFDYEPVYRLFGHMLNNIGDPYRDPTFRLHTKPIEQEVIAFFADLFRAPKDDRWGYVTNGSTEGNLYALFLARELYPEGMVYFSVSTHYSVQKNIHLLRMPSITIRAQANGEIDYDDLAQVIGAHRDRPAIVFANIGTTMHEARDDVKKIKKVLAAQAIINHYVHSDAALSGVVAALTEPHHPFDFEDGADSVVVSGHKFIGSPMPCGVVVVRKSLKDRIGNLVQYINTHDTTISGSRNGHTPLLLWYAIQKFGVEGFRKRAQQGITTADYALERLLAIGWDAWRNLHTLTVMLATPPVDLINKWQLSTASGWSHIVCVPGVTKKHIDRFIDELSNVAN